jgi:cysteinyl-tRNA synthetase
MTDRPTLRLYNTLTRSKEVFTPLNDKAVRMYVCGPTVYDYAHIGNARPVIVFDVLFRLLRHLYGEQHVIYARNITDVDDKINARAARDYPGLPLNEAIRNVTKKTTKQFHDDVAALGCLPPTEQPRATDHIEQMIDIICRLLDNGYAYIAAGAEGREVLFSVSKMPRYGQLSNRKLDEQRSGARVAVESHKRDPGDFVLWKESDADQPGWEATFRPDPAYRANAETVTIFGRPGWHIECSAMSMTKLLEPIGGGLACDDPVKNTFDIHGGGIDLVFPHHENEIAQSCCAFGTDRMATTWMHNGFLQIEGKKMSKSDGNFFTIDELRNTTKFGGRTWPGEVLRLAMLKTHYRQPIDFTVRALEEAAETVSEWRRRFSSQFDSDKIVDPEFINALKDDMNLPNALARLFFLSRKPNDESEVDAVDRHRRFKGSLSILGLEKIVDEPVLGDWITDPNVEALIDQRLAARRAKDFATSDRIRDELLAMGIEFKDGKDPVTGEPTTTWEVKR